MTEHRIDHKSQFIAPWMSCGCWFVTSVAMSCAASRPAASSPWRCQWGPVGPLGGAATEGRSRDFFGANQWVYRPIKSINIWHIKFVWTKETCKNHGLLMFFENCAVKSPQTMLYLLLLLLLLVLQLLNRELQTAVGTAGSQPRPPDLSGHCRTSTIQNSKIECQKESQKGCQIECQNICQIECRIECQKESQKGCQIECQNICQIECRIECQIECQKGCQIECHLVGITRRK